MFENKKIFILGMARSGYNVAKLLANNNEILITDKADQDENLVKELESLNVKFIKIDDPIDLLDSSFDLVIKNPGIMPFHETLKKAESLNIPILNEMEVAYHFLPKDIKIIGITGSNGKTTTTTMVYEILKNAGLPVILGGNIGYPLSEVIPKVKSNDILVLEISDHQLINFKDFKTDISVLTNIYPTHLDYHLNYDNYKMAKKNIFNNHTENDLAIINYNNSDSIDITKDINSSKVYFNDNQNFFDDNSIYIDGNAVLNIEEILLKGKHNYENILACLLILKELKVDYEYAKEYFKSFKGVEHRLEFVRNLNGVTYYNDSKSTNPSSTIMALESFKNKKIHLILGGMERSQDFNELNDYMSNVKKIYAIGEVEERIYDYANEKNIDCIKCETIKNALCQINPEADEVVLLSPACASWDQYKKFEDRGDEFKNIVNNL